MRGGFENQSTGTNQNDSLSMKYTADGITIIEVHEFSGNLISRDECMKDADDRFRVQTPDYIRPGIFQSPLPDVNLEVVARSRSVLPQTIISWNAKSVAFSSIPSGRPGEPRGSPVSRLAVAGVKSIIAVASGKGGVGKSTTAVNLAVALALQHKLRVGLLDADVYGPSVPTLMKLQGRPQLDKESKMLPLENYGVKCMSMGFLMDKDAPAVWRGPMVMSALEKLTRGTAWGNIDVLVVDMPPGTGDVQISISQRLPLAGAVIVSTPQDLALVDARRGVNMFQKVDVPILGIIENMSYFKCPKCGERSDIFGHGGAKSTSEEMSMEFLGEIPLNIALRETSDVGEPIVAFSPNSEISGIYSSIARRIEGKLGELASSDGSGGPRIVIK
ncbi:hypothetical protein R1flu_027759 [Riccia fluitans]|uniref:Nucleotide-binding protein-like n=1 Tax=Riccia fluitans TaxID=41844 RepID=A0ABD1XJT6_9MARC